MACMQARAGRNYTSSSLLATLADTVEGAISARLRTTSTDSPCSLGRSARLTVRCLSATLVAVKADGSEHILDVLPAVWTASLRWLRSAADEPAAVIDGSM